ncbi:uncharacterized protein LOC110008365 [Amborella trichopoda]|nr:uncharacterized protein LOC110008365 [Amborella trichopoda]|eukprot:XP_020530900.1 uncharacterized protein LOC110008365 [Amborella trichopoda]
MASSNRKSFIMDFDTDFGEDMHENQLRLLLSLIQTGEGPRGMLRVDVLFRALAEEITARPWLNVFEQQQQSTDPPVTFFHPDGSLGIAAPLPWVSDPPFLFIHPDGSVTIADQLSRLPVPGPRHDRGGGSFWVAVFILWDSIGY